MIILPTTKEIALELVKAIMPKVDKKIVQLQKQINKQQKTIAGLETKIQSLSSVLMNKRKHKKKTD